MKSNNQKLYKIGEVAGMLGIHNDTLRNWEKTGIIVPERIGKRQDRRYTPEHIRKIMEEGLISSLAKRQPEKKDYSQHSREQLIKELHLMREQRKYGLVWEDKPEEVVERCKKEAPILAIEKELKIKDENKNMPNNILIEGDNYHALQVLNYTHKGKIDVIYIDPPYNTGKVNEWRYNDKYVDSTDQFKHSKWLSFMEKRLRLAKNLLSNKGVIFISIDDNEQANLKLLCDSIFGEENFISCINIYSNPRGRQSSKHIAATHEYVLIYAKISYLLEIIGEKLTEEQKRQYNKKDEKGAYREMGLRKRGSGSTAEESPKLYFPIYINPYDESIHLNSKEGFFEVIPRLSNKVLGRWRWSKKKIEKDKEYLLARKVKRGDVYEYDVFQKDYLKDDTERKIKSSWIEKDINYDRSSKEQRDIFGDKAFDYAKPVYLLNKILKISSLKDSVVLDFFAGSGTTGHAVMELNKEDKGSRQFILCTNNENNIAREVCYERVKKVMKGYKKNGNGEQMEGLGGNLEYFKTEFVDVENINEVSDKKKLEFTHEAGWTIALRENTFLEIDQNHWYQIFTDGKDKFVGVYFREKIEKLKELEKKILDKKDVKLYLFSYGGKNEWKNDYAEYNNVTVEDIPEPILKVYRGLNS